ncbi:carbon-nitrogen family hydrolase [Flexivirga sp. ID2601S]|uniref:Carbon-nitrogen family hydrolase n=1 Tax=Flexivirga aerilata TaxID=1656889 RepID=A0A849APC5_9MICO|nr:carbon-nitrogen family hydrolase [Flexivirga aerilata]NNG38632.1 carbon-nitrogen family hydrolase [Flexivirga aerilata]
MRVCLIQLAYDDDESLAERTRRVAGLVREQAGADLVVLPELWSAGGFSYREWPERSQDVRGEVAQALAAAAADAGVWLHGGSIAERPDSGETGPEGKSLWNTSLVFSPSGELLATYRKIHRFGFAGGEPKLMEAGTDLVFLDAVGLRAGLSTCYDLRFPELYRAQLDQGATAFVIPAAWPMARLDAWRLLLRARAVENQCLVLGCNTAGTHAGTQMAGHSAVVAPTGEVLAEAGDDQEVLRVDFDVDTIAAFRQDFPVLADRRL